jgi:hypothetical protein
VSREIENFADSTGSQAALAGGGGVGGLLARLQQPEVINEYEADQGDKSPIEIGLLVRLELLIGVVLSIFHR